VQTSAEPAAESDVTRACPSAEVVALLTE